MSEMIEIVAKAICRSSCDSDEDFEMMWGAELVRHNRMIEARAAIAAMREPTEAMERAYYASCDENGMVLWKTGYRAMIDAALAHETMTEPTHPTPSAGR